jgi:hypothetical protein
VADLSRLLEKMQGQREAFAGIPRESAGEILEEAIGKLLLLPGVESATIAGADTAASLLLSAFAPNAPFAALEVKGIDLLLHTVAAWLENKQRLAVAKGDALSA